MSTVLWGARKGDVLYGSVAFWRRNIPIGASTIVVDSAAFFDVYSQWQNSSTGEVMTVVGMEGTTIGIDRP